MKIAPLIFLAMVNACTSAKIPPFQKEQVCSNETLRYLNKNKHLPPSNVKNYSESEIHQRMIGLEPQIRACYEEEMLNKYKFDSFNLCFVVGYDSKGKMEFFEFSTNEIELADEFKSCLEKLKLRDELKGLKGISIIQPFSLYPSSKN